MRSFWLIVCATVLTLGLSACGSTGHGGYRVTVESPPAPPSRTVIVQERPGPPPHAPAHGYRHKYHDHGHDYELVFDSGVGCYTVVGYRDVYFNDGAYFRFGSDGWQVSASFGESTRWEYVAESRVPGGLKVKYKDKGHSGGGKGRGEGKGKSEGKGKGEGKGKQKFSSADHWGKYGS
jgi:hypothetical protein